MASIKTQRDLVLVLKKETLLNVWLLSKLQPVSAELSRQVLKEKALDKPTQVMFNHLSHYLVNIIDPQASATMSWPLYDSKTERAYRNELYNFIMNYAKKGLLNPVRSSYLVNPSCYKVTVLIFQLSQLAVQKLLTSKLNDNQKKLYNEMSNKFKSDDKAGFIKDIESETKLMSSKFSNYLIKRQCMEKVAEMFRAKITQMESKLDEVKAQKFIDELIDGYLSKHSVDEETKIKILSIKDVKRPSPFFDMWLTEVDLKIEELESKWEEKVTPFMDVCQNAQTCTEALISRHTGAGDRSAYMVEYNHAVNEINTFELQQQVNSQQKYVLKNIVKDEKLNFPNLIRGFLIAISFILRNADIDEDIFKFNEYLEGGKRNYEELVMAMRSLVERVMNADAKLQYSPKQHYSQSISIEDMPEIPPLPDLSDLRSTKEYQCQNLFDSFTPLSMSKHQFNLGRKSNFSFAKPPPKSLIMPLLQPPKDDFTKSFVSCRISSYDRHNITQNFHNMSVISQTNRANETIAECSSGFTKQQILRLLSTKKSSCSKKFKYKTERPDINIKKGGLFNETSTSNDSNGLFRSYSSPNLFENREKRPSSRTGFRKLSIMEEDSPNSLNVSGITALDRDSSFVTLNNDKEDSNANDTIKPISNNIESQNFHDKLKDFKIDLDKELLIENVSPIEPPKAETPKNTQLVKKTSSLEKIINRYKKVRAKSIPEKQDDLNDFKTITEEKEHFKTVNIDVFNVNRVLLPDLLSPSCNLLSKSKESDNTMALDSDEDIPRKPRESLGAALGVDYTFLDNLVD